MHLLIKINWHGLLIENGNIANQIHGFTIDYGKFILMGDRSISTLHCTICLKKCTC